MKKAIAFVAAALMSVSAFAGDIWVGGSIGAWRNSTDKITTVSLTPEIGYNLSDNFSIATSIGYKFVGRSGADNHAFIFNPYARYTFAKVGIVGFFVDGGVDLSLGSTHYKHADNSKTSAVVGIGFKPGISLNLNSHCGLVAHFGFLGYRYVNDAAEVAGEKGGGGFDLSNGMSFGFYYTF